MNKAFLLVTASIWFGAVAKASGKSPEELQHLKARANLVFVGQVLSKPERSPIVISDTYATFNFRLRILQVLKGARPASSENFSAGFNSGVKVERHGSVTRIHSPSSAPPPPVKVGARYVFFLSSGTMIGIRPYSQPLMQRLRG